MLNQNSQFDVAQEWQPERLQVLEFGDGSELLYFFDEGLQSGKFKLHPWQIQLNEEFAHAQATDQHPFKFALRAANGSGKDAFIVAPFALWFIVSKIKSRVIITSSSGTQLTSQTEVYISNLARKINTYYFTQFGAKIMKINQRYIQCLLSGSEIRMFATDEEGRAEGYHPIEPGAEMAIIVNEAKSVTSDIFRALRRCTGYNYWINVSTPGLVPAGDFYKSCLTWKHRKITYYDCPHQSSDEFNADKRELGEHSALFRSKWLAEFTTVDGNTIIPQAALEKLRGRIRENRVLERCTHWPVRVGIDLSTSGDETVVSAWKGNTQIYQRTWREKDTTVTVERIWDCIVVDLKLPQSHEFIYADDGGVGRAIIDQLRKRGLSNIRRILNQSAAIQTSLYRNRGAELWYNFRRLVEEGILRFNADDDKLWEQLGTRRFRNHEEQAIIKIQLEAKAVARAEGLPSPDRADAAVLAFVGITVNSFLDEETKIEKVKDQIVKRRLSAAQLMEEVDNAAFEGTGLQGAHTQSRRIKGSVKTLLKHDNSGIDSFISGFSRRS